MGFTKGFWKGEDDLKERERERCQWVATQDFSFLWKTKWEREAYIIFFSLCGRKEWRKEGRKGCCTADTRFCVQSASNLIRLFLGTLLTRRSLLILFDCFSLSLSRYIYIYMTHHWTAFLFVCLLGPHFYWLCPSEKRHWDAFRWGPKFGAHTF